jgi:tRNA(fMet)-specific endonuclease VapC
VSGHVGRHTPAELTATVITVQEQLDGWYARLPRARRRDELARIYQRLADNVRFLGRLQLLSFTEPAILRYEHLRTLKLNIGKMDLRIAAIVLEHGVILVTRNVRDFQRVPQLVFEDWSQ